MPLSGKYLNEIEADPDLVAAMQLVLPLINTSKTTLGMTTQQVTDLTNACNAYIAQYTAMNAAKAAAKAAVSQKDTLRKTATKQLYDWIKVWRANQAVPDSLLAQLLVAPHNTPPNHTPPVTVTELVAYATGQGDVELRWNRGTNKSGTQYIVESRHSNTGSWEFEGVSTKSKFVTTATPGQYVSYRITSFRGGEKSQPSQAVSLWDNGQTGALRVAA